MASKSGTRGQTLALNGDESVERARGLTVVPDFDAAPIACVMLYSILADDSVYLVDR